MLEAAHTVQLDGLKFSEQAFNNDYDTKPTAACV